MAILQAQKLNKSFGERTVFSDVTFEVFPKDHIGLIGVNGSGKTTLFHMLTGKEPCDGGQISTARGVRVAALEQSPVWPEHATLYEAVLETFRHFMRWESELTALSDCMECAGEVTDSMLRRQAELTEAYQQDGGLTYKSRTRATLLGLGFTEAELASPVARMSGGQQRKAALSKLLLSGADVLLLDEPTNHLDIRALEWLEAFLTGFSGAYIVISHDRYFLDHVCTRMLELENGVLHAGSGGYTQYTEHKLDERAFAMRHYQNGLREIKRIEGIIEQQRRWNQARNYVTIASKQKQIERLKSELVKPEEAPRSIRFSLRADELTCSEVIVCRHLRKAFGEKVLFDDLNLLVHNGERICLIGENGCGKTTLLRILTGQEPSDGGTYTLGPNVRVGYFEQTTVHTEDTNTVLGSLQDAFPRYDQTQLRSLLGTFLFRGDEVFKRLDTLSGGEYARIQMLKLMLRGNNVLLLDEPTNHLDIPSREALEDALNGFGGTMLIVTHDRYLANRIADRILIMDGTGITEFSGDWDAYKSFLKETEEAEAAPAAPAEKNAYVLHKERRAACNRAKGELQRAERAVQEGEASVFRLETELAKPEIASDYETAGRLYKELEDARAALEAAYAAWEQAENELAKLSEEDV